MPYIDNQTFGYTLSFCQLLKKEEVSQFYKMKENKTGQTLLLR